MTYARRRPLYGGMVMLGRTGFAEGMVRADLKQQREQQLKQLEELKASGVLTPEEFETVRQRLMGK